MAAWIWILIAIGVLVVIGLIVVGALRGRETEATARAGAGAASGSGHADPAGDGARTSRAGAGGAGEGVAQGRRGSRRARRPDRPGHGHGSLLARSDVPLRAEVRCAADQVVHAVPTVCPPRLASGEAGLASPAPPAVFWIQPPRPDRGRLGEAQRPAHRERREDDPEETELELPFQQGHDEEAADEHDEPVADDPPEPVAGGVGRKRECRQDREPEECDRRQAGIDRQSPLLVQ